MSSKAVSLQDRSVGVVERDDGRVQEGYTLLCSGESRCVRACLRACDCAFIILRAMICVCM